MNTRDCGQVKDFINDGNRNGFMKLANYQWKFSKTNSIDFAWDI